MTVKNLIYCILIMAAIIGYAFLFINMGREEERQKCQISLEAVWKRI